MNMIFCFYWDGALSFIDMRNSAFFIINSRISRVFVVNRPGYCCYFSLTGYAWSKIFTNISIPDNYSYVEYTSDQFNLRGSI